MTLEREYLMDPTTILFMTKLSFRLFMGLRYYHGRYHDHPPTEVMLWMISKYILVGGMISGDVKIHTA